ncbi:MAG: hypothetical protein CL927_19460 [Deltaproteobacteria bacterium]|nr:hypothetical protein [Deltaproteobacteria bacterium]HCH65628.1 hypothetical protein [Deltaproteobacteria bacterium]
MTLSPSSTGRDVGVVLWLAVLACGSKAPSVDVDDAEEQYVPGTDASSEPTDTAADTDLDGDGHAAPEDCDDSDASTFPGAEESR